MTKEIIQRIRECKALKDKTISDIIDLPEFEKNLAIYMKEQLNALNKVDVMAERTKRLYPRMGLKRPRHVIDRLVEKGVFAGVESFKMAFVDEINMECHYSANERKYIEQLGMQAYNLTVAQIVCKEFPELSKDFGL